MCVRQQKAQALRLLKEAVAGLRFRALGLHAGLAPMMQEA